MARQHSARRKAGITIAAWAAGFIIFFPILWMVLTSFKSEVDAFASPPKFLFFHWTTENYAAVEARSDYFHFAWNSILLSVGSTLVGLLFAVPAAGRWRSRRASAPRTCCCGCSRPR